MTSRRIHQPYFFIFLVWLVLAITPTLAQETATLDAASVDDAATDTGEAASAMSSDTTTEDKKDQVVVDDYLDTLSNDELRTICEHRGFDVKPRTDGAEFQREDYLEAARRCLSLEDEMNAILAENPDLAAELEVEIERMKQEKARLEQEREGMLAEMKMLQMQLEQAGMDLKAAGFQTAEEMEKATAGGDSSTVQSFDEVLIESLREVGERVRRDVKMVYSVLRPVLAPIGGALKLLWRYTKPILIGLYKQGLEKIRNRNNNDEDEEMPIMPTATATAEPPR